MPMTIPNPTTLISYRKSVDAGLVDKSYQELMGKKIEVNADRIGWSPDLEWNQYARAEMIRGIGPKMQAALGMMTVGQFATTRGGMGFAALEAVIGREAVTNLRTLQRALQACMPVPDEPVALKQVSAARFAELFESDFNGHDPSEITIEDLMLDLDVTTDSAARKEQLDDLVSFIGFGVMYGSIAMHESGMPAVEIAAAVDQTLAGMGEVCKTAEETEYVIQEMVKVVDVYLTYLPEVVQAALAEIMPS